MSENNWPPFDAINWVNGYFAGGARINYEELQPVLCFSLIWNMFESVTCHRHATIASIRTGVEQVDQAGLLDIAKYQPYLDYVRQRYLKNGTIDEMFDALIMTEARSRIVVERVMRGQSTDLNNIVYALLLIALRIRNNLFHGNKPVESLHRQTELFHVVNRLLSDYIDDFRLVPRGFSRTQMSN